MASKAHQPPQTRLAKVLVPAYERIIKAASWRKHSKLISESKQAIEFFSRAAAERARETPPLPPPTIRKISAKAPESKPPKESKPAGEADVGTAAPEPDAATVPEKQADASSGQISEEVQSADKEGSGKPEEPTEAPVTSEAEKEQEPEAKEVDPAEANNDASSVHSAIGSPAPEEFPWGAPRQIILFDEGEVGLSQDDAELVLQPLISACETSAPKVVEPVLDAVQKLIAHGHLRGELDVGTSPDTKLLLEIVDGVCRCYDVSDENAELLIMRALLTAVTSATFQIHGESLLKVVRTCYNIFLGSKSVVNQTTAKATLTQMLVLVFRRMEADSSTVPVTPIVVADLMEPAERSTADHTAVQFVQNFVNKVVQDLGEALVVAQHYQYQLPKGSRPGEDGAFDTTPDEASHPAEDDNLRDKDMLEAKQWELGMYKDALSKGPKKPAIEKAASAAEEEVDAAELQSGNKLRRDAFLVFRALCKLSMKAPPQEGLMDPVALRGKVVALELVKILLENAGLVFRTNERFVGAIKQYLCLSLLKNSASPVMAIFQLSCSIFMSLVARFRAGLKAEIGVFFPMIVLRVLENIAQPNFQQKMIVLRFLEKLSIDPQILVDVFVNYDCDLDSSNVFERMVNGLLKTAQGVPPGAETTLSPQQDTQMRLAAIKCLVGVLRSMGNWTNRQFNLTPPGGAHHALAPGTVAPTPRGPDRDDAGSSTSEVGHSGGLEHVESSSDLLSEAGELSEAAQFEQRRAYKLEFQEGISLFNRKPKKGIEFLIKSEKLGGLPEEIATFLHKTPGLDKVMIGEYLGERDDVCIKVMHAYIDALNFTDMEFDNSIRAFVGGFRLPGEAQKIDRLMEKFAERFCKCNPRAFSSADTAYVLAYSVILLNTDAHNPMVKTKMSKEQFIRNNRGIDESGDLPEEFLTALYDRIVKNEIKMKSDAPVAKSAQPTHRGAGLDSILNLVVPRRRQGAQSDTSEDVIKHTQELFRQKAGKAGSVYYAASDVEIVRPMVEVVWAPMLAAFSVPLDKSDDEVVTYQCLEGFRHAIHVSAMMQMETIRDAYITSLAKFTSLHSVADIKRKNIDAIKTLMSVAEEDGNYLQDAWEHILTCISRFEHLHQISEGVMTDSALFAEQGEKAKGAKGGHRPKPKGRPPAQAIAASAIVKRGSYDSAGVGGQTTSGATPEQITQVVSNLSLLEAIDNTEINRIFVRSEKLNSEAIVEFVKALCKVSLDELRSPKEARIFSLTKIVEIAHFNMNRIRLVWTRIWQVLAEYFVTVGCSESLSVAMYAVDSLRQLAMKFLERDELSNYNFQNDFLKPFVVVMRRSGSVEIRELIIRCVSQMVFARVVNVKSGWKVMFMVFTTAAADEHKNIVLLAFETIERIVREYFSYITETETTTFTDCVNCLIAFTNSRYNKDVSLNAIAFLRFCALKLAEGELGRPVPRKDRRQPAAAKVDASTQPLPPLPPPPAEAAPPAPSSAPMAPFTDRDDHLYFWFPLLAGLSELTFDPRPDVRKGALEVLFDTLRYHGHMFSPALWERVFDSVLFPIFDYVRRASVRRPVGNLERARFSDGDDVTLTAPGPAAGRGVEGSGDDGRTQEELEMDAWLYETCTLALQLVVDLFVKFYTVVNPLLGRILNLLTGFIKRPHQSLAAIGVAAFVRLTGSAGDLFSPENWDQILQALQESVTATLPDLYSLVAEEPGASPQSADGYEAALGADVADRDVAEGAVDEAALSPGPAKLQQAVVDMRCRMAVQLLLVQAMTELYTAHAQRMGTPHALQLLDILLHMASHARDLNSDRGLRAQLYQIRAITQLPDPPMLRLENEAFHAYLMLLQRLPTDKPELLTPEEGQPDLEGRLLDLCCQVLSMYIRTAQGGSTASTEGAGKPQAMARWAVPLGTARRRELTARAPLVVTCIRAMGSLKEPQFRAHITKTFFPLLTQLIGCEHATQEVQAAVGNLCVTRIGPLIFGQLSLPIQVSPSQSSRGTLVES